MAPQVTQMGADLWLSWLVPRPDGGHRLGAARMGSGAWEPAILVTEGTDLLANWADVPSLIPLPGGAMAAQWLVSAGKGHDSYSIEIASADPGGRDWRRLGAPHKDDGPGEHGFVSSVLESPSARLFWLDGRLLAGGQEEHDGGAMQLRTAVLTRHAIGPESILDGDVCTCCPTSAVMGAGGPVVFYRDHAPGEIRDIAFVRWTASGWSDPAALHDDGWEVPGCPVNGPVAAASGDGSTIAVAWFTAPGNMPRVRAAFSRDGGASFTSPLEIDADRPHGRPGIVLTGDAEAVVIWMASGGADHAEIRMRRINAEGRMGEPLLAGRTRPGRSSGIPRLASAGSDLLAVWTQTEFPAGLRAALVPGAAVPAIN